MLCGREGVAGATCRWCAVPLPTPRDEPGLLAAACARCGRRMQPIGISPRGEATPAVLHVCNGCHAMFVPPRAWHVLLTRPDRVARLEATLAPAPAPAPSPAAQIRSVRCPACGAEMERLRFAAVADVVVDTCGRRHGVWLDAGELRGIARFKERRDEVGTRAVRLEADAAEPVARTERVVDAPPPATTPWWRTTTARVSLLVAIVVLQLLAIRCTRSGAAVRDGQSLVKQAGPSAASALGR